MGAVEMGAKDAKSGLQRTNTYHGLIPPRWRLDIPNFAGLHTIEFSFLSENELVWGGLTDHLPSVTVRILSSSGTLG
jgi:hypothetical protein